MTFCTREKANQGICTSKVKRPTYLQPVLFLGIDESEMCLRHALERVEAPGSLNRLIDLPRGESDLLSARVIHFYLSIKLLYESFMPNETMTYHSDPYDKCDDYSDFKIRPTIIYGDAIASRNAKFSLCPADLILDGLPCISVKVREKGSFWCPYQQMRYSNYLPMSREKNDLRSLVPL